MKKILGLLTLTLTLLFGFSTENINAQNDYNKTDNHGRRQGKWIDFHDNGKIRYTESKDLVEYSEPVSVNIDNFDKKIWHKEIQYIDDKYVCIFMIKYKSYNCCNYLSHYSCNRSTGNSKFRKSQKSKN